MLIVCLKQGSLQLERTARDARSMCSVSISATATPGYDNKETIKSGEY